MHASPRLASPRLASGLIVLGLLTTLVRPAAARPVGYESAGCAVEGVSVCNWNGGIGRWVCELETLGGGGGATAWMIYGERLDIADSCGNICDGKLYCAFGERDGQKFYCDLPQAIGQNLKDGSLVGTEDADTLSFWYEEGSAKCAMKHHGLNLTTIPTVRGTMQAGPGGDTLHGSWISETSYQDWLYGDNGDDYIYGHEGADRLFGGSGYDRMHGGAQDDLIEGNDTADYISGGSGDDAIYGGPWSDFVCGDEGDDTIHGGVDYDYLTGGLGTDLLDGAGESAWCYDDGVDTLVNCDSATIIPWVCPPDVLPY